MSHGGGVQAIIDGFADTMLTNYLVSTPDRARQKPILKILTNQGVSGHALVVADFLHTFPDEVRLMWPTPFSLPKVLFFALRYYVMVQTAFAASYGLPRGMSPEQCEAAFLRIGSRSLHRSPCMSLTARHLVSSIIVMIASEGRDTVRPSVRFLREEQETIGVSDLPAIHATAFALLTKFIKTVHFVKFPIDNLVCMPAQARNVMLSGVFALLLGSVVIVMFIMMYLAFRKHRDLNSALLTIFYRDGIFYFICLSILASGNIIVNLAAPSGGMKFLLVQTEVNLHVILSTRMLLHLRSWAERDRYAEGRGRDTGTMGAFEYSTNYGNRGGKWSTMKFERPALETIQSVSVTQTGTETTGEP
ncbi:hypothetical protein NMY22_g7710 [Coprinellus aureogranulatus]|nr:hypothetical protein NMY22_g7710 [Coprinellus aureogranulatus]